MTATPERPAPPVFQPPPGNPRYPLIDSVRGIAALMVVITHAGLLSGANQGAGYGPYVARLEMALTLFFVVSGFVLYRPYVAGKLGVGRAPRLRNYARGRVLRIVPAYWVALTVLGIYPGLEQFWGGDVWPNYLFIQTWTQDWFLHGIKPAWSLSVEVSFYALLPLLAWAMLRVTRDRSRRAKLWSEAWLFVILVAIGIGYRVAVRGAVGDDPFSHLWALLPASIDWLAVGMGLAAVSAALEGRPRKPRAIELIERWPGICWIGAAVLFWVAATRIGLDGQFPQPTSTFQWTFVHELYGVIAALIIAPAVFGHTRGGFVRAVMRNRLLAWFGVVSYGIFLYHHPIMEALVGSDLAQLWEGFPMLGLTVATLLLATACAAVSYYALERPIMRWQQRSRRRAATPSGARKPEPVGPAA